MMQTLPIPNVPIPAEVVPFLYTPLVYQQLPTPLPPVTEALPDVQRQYEIEEEKRKLKEKETKVMTQPKRSGLFGGMVDVFEGAAVYVEKGIHELKTTIDDGIRSSNFDAAQKKFFYSFRLPTELLIREYYCRCNSGPYNVYGNMYISEHYMGFCGDIRIPRPNVSNPPTNRLVFLIPLRNIRSIQFGISGPFTGNSAPTINLCDQTKGDSLLVYTAEGSIHQFFSFWQISATYNVLDHVWRACFSDPTPLPFPMPLNQALPPFTPIDRKFRPGLAHMNTNTNTNNTNVYSHIAPAPTPTVYTTETTYTHTQPLYSPQPQPGGPVYTPVSPQPQPGVPLYASQPGVPMYNAPQPQPGVTIYSSPSPQQGVPIYAPPGTQPTDNQYGAY